MQIIVGQLRVYSPQATLIICTQPNELMTYVALRISGFPKERVFGLGAGITTAHVHRTILERTKNIHGHVNGLFIVGGQAIDDSCTAILAEHVTINGIHCVDIRTDTMTKSHVNRSVRSQSMSKSKWNLIDILTNNISVYSNIQRRTPITHDLVQRQNKVVQYLQSSVHRSPLQSTIFNTIEIPSIDNRASIKTKAMLIVRLIRALVNGHEFQSNLAVNIMTVHRPHDVVINYPVTIGSSNRGVEYMLPCSSIQQTLHQQSFVISYEKCQQRIAWPKSND
jgi:malate/lactate dehydrogenase